MPCSHDVPNQATVAAGVKYNIKKQGSKRADPDRIRAGRAGLAIAPAHRFKRALAVEREQKPAGRRDYRGDLRTSGRLGAPDDAR